MCIMFCRGEICLYFIIYIIFTKNQFYSIVDIKLDIEFGVVIISHVFKFETNFKFDKNSNKNIIKNLNKICAFLSFFKNS